MADIEHDKECHLNSAGRLPWDDACTCGAQEIADLRAQLAEKDARIDFYQKHGCMRCKVKGDSSAFHFVPLCDDLRAQLAARDEEVGRLREILLDVLKVNPDAPDCIDNDGCPYQSQYLADWLSAALKGEGEG